MNQMKYMVAGIEQEILYTRDAIGRSAFDKRVMDAVKKVPRHKFVPQDMLAYAYDDRPLPIGEGQTISQPYMVALMTDLLALDANDVVLEVGTGSGYQTAILAQLVKQVYSIEIIPALQEHAAKLLQTMGYRNVELRLGDGYGGWPEHAPYDGVIVTAAAMNIPPPLEDQLKPNGKLVIPVGLWGFSQELFLVEKDKNGNISHTSILPVAFVPLTGDRAVQQRKPETTNE